MEKMQFVWNFVSEITMLCVVKIIQIFRQRMVEVGTQPINLVF